MDSRFLLSQSTGSHRLKTFFCALLIGLGSAHSANSQEVSGLVQLNFSQADATRSFFDNGIGALRYDDDKLQLQQTLLHYKQDLGQSWSLDAVANYYQDGVKHLGLTQLQLQYRPLSRETVRWRGRAGFFYPRMSAENLDVGWLSPFTYTNSAINSWIGEELRIAGAEITAYSPGRQRRSPWSWETHLGLFMGNDPTGTLLAWRGFAQHDRQSLHHDQVGFAPVPSVVDPPPFDHPAWVEPFHEIDQRPGFYLGAHLRYLNKSTLRYYYYDNLADPTKLNRARLYAWRTKFHSIAADYQFNKETRVIAQWLTGSTEMGENKKVFADFDAFYLMLSHKTGPHRFSIRYDRFLVQEDDTYRDDYNDSDGYSYTLAWRYTWDENWQLGLEWHDNQNSAKNRQDLGLPTDLSQQQTLGVVQYRF